MKLWVFGDSLSLPFNIDPEYGWANLLAKRLNCEVENLAMSAADNFYIYSVYRHTLPRISQNDIVIVGWSHPSRKTFILDRSNPAHVDSLKHSILYNNTGIEFIRSNNQVSDTLEKWLNLSPMPRNKPFYDTWYRDYYSDTEQKTSLTAYHGAVDSTCPGFYFSFFFSKESISGLDLHSNVGTIIDFIAENNCSLSQEDAHPNIGGHQLWADRMFDYIQTNRKKSIFPVIELIDRYAIAKLKFSKSVGNLEEVEFYNDQLKCYNLDLVNDMIDKLYQIHSNIWALEAELKSGRESSLDLSEIGKRAIEIRDWNNRRVALKNQIAELLECPVREIKKDHLSQ
jgi:hypothetical protein